jgi:hypothetical protein
MKCFSSRMQVNQTKSLSIKFPLPKPKAAEKTFIVQGKRNKHKLYIAQISLFIIMCAIVGGNCYSRIRK